MADRKFRVVVAGAGVSGLFMAEMLNRARIDFAVYKKAGEVGGTWRDNTFPGLFVDVLSRQYEFPFQPNFNWSRKYAPATPGRRCDLPTSGPSHLQLGRSRKAAGIRAGVQAGVPDDGPCTPASLAGVG